MGGGNLSLFLLAAVIIAAIPGPGIFYVAARTLSGGRQAGIASTFGSRHGIGATPPSTTRALRQTPPFISSAMATLTTAWVQDSRSRIL